MPADYSFRQTADPIADQLVVQLYQTQDKQRIAQLYRHLLSDIEEVDYQGLPFLVKAYFQQNQGLPDWINWAQIRQVQQLYLSMGAEYASALILRALPIGYSSANIVKLLAKTGYLASYKRTGTAKRLLETSQFLFNMMREDCFEHNSVGLKHILKVRFIHAMVRHHLHKHKWDVQSRGLPINQEDMSMTILTFSVGAIKGLERMNIALSRADKDAFVHYWAVIGHIIGVDDTINPTTYMEGEKHYENILLHQAKACPEGIELTRCLCDFVKAAVDVSWAPNVSDYTMRYLINSNYYSDILGLKPVESPLDKLVFFNAVNILKILNKNREYPLIKKIIQPSNRFFTYRIINYFDREFDLKLYIPLKLKKSWGL